MYGCGARSGQIIGCANIEPSNVVEEQMIIEISFPRNGTDPDDIDRYASTSNVIDNVVYIYIVSIKSCMLVLQYVAISYLAIAAYINGMLQMNV